MPEEKDRPIPGSPASPAEDIPAPVEEEAPDACEEADLMDEDIPEADEEADLMEEEPPVDDAAARRQKLHKRHMRALRDLLIRFGLLCLVVYILFFQLVGLTVMPSGDMSPRVDAGDLVMYYRLEKTFRAQDIIVFEKPTAALDRAYKENVPVDTASAAKKAGWRRALGFRDPAMTLFVCRVVAAPGDTVEISGEHLLVNGNAVAEPNIFYSTPEYEGFVEYPLTLGEDQYFVLADHRTDGKDSRFFGVVEKDEILGTVITIVRRNNL